MNGTGRTLLRYGGSIVVSLALVTSLTTVSHAQPRPEEAGGRLQQRLEEAEGRLHQRLEEAEGKLHQRRDEAGGKLHPRRPVRKVPEPSTTSLLLLGIGLTGLAGYYWRRRTRGA